MQNFDRSDEPAPACLSDERSREARELLHELFNQDNRRQAQTRISMGAVAVQDEELAEALARLFRGKCAFCERRTWTRPYRFRPTEEAGPRDQAPAADRHRAHLYYAWLTNAWQNLYPICDDCFPREPSIFPVRGSRTHLPDAQEIDDYLLKPTGSWRGRTYETAVFLDPCGRADLRKHLAFTPDGTVLALSTSGDATISQFDLNRRELILGRRSVFDRCFAELEQTGSWGRLKPWAFKEMDHGGAWFLLLYQLAKRTGGGQSALTRNKIEDFYIRRWEDPQFVEALKESWSELVRNPFSLVQEPHQRVANMQGGPFPVRFKVHDFKGLEYIDLDLGPNDDQAADGTPIGPALVILGENAAGKTSLLEAIELALCDDEEREAVASDARPYLLDPGMMGSERDNQRRPGSVEVTFEDGSTVVLRFGSRGFKRTVTSARDGFPSRLPVFAYGAYRLFLKDGVTRGKDKRIRSLFSVGTPLSNPDAWLFSIRGTPLFDEVVRALRAILSIGQAFQTIEADESTQGCFLVIGSERQESQILLTRIPLALVSSGFRAVLGTACDVMRNLDSSRETSGTTLAKSKAIVVIDEIEAHLHPRWKMRIVQGLREALPNVLFVVSTHDPLCLRGLASSRVRVLRRRVRDNEDRDVLPTVVELLDDLPPIGALTVEQLLTSDFFQLFSTDDEAFEIDVSLVADLLSLERAGQLDASSEEQLERIRRRIEGDVSASLPVGSTVVERLVQDAVETYLRTRPREPAASLSSLRASTRNRIAAILQSDR